MKLKIVTYLLLLSIAIPTGACSADDKKIPAEGPGGSDSKPISEKMYVKRKGDDLYISAKMSANTDILYWFKRCMFNELYTFYRVGTIFNREPEPILYPETEPQTVLNRAFSDNIGPFAIAGCGWCGGNHKYAERTARTAYNKSYAIFVDGKKLEGDTEGWASKIVVEVENVILDPSRPYTGAGGVEELRDPLCHEFAVYDICRNNIEVAVRHRFCNTNPVTVAIYYGMQSMFENETHTFTSAGAYSDWTAQSDVSSFTKQDYPTFRRFLEKNGAAYQSAYLLPDGLGDHAALGAQDVVFIGNSYGKSYHKLIADKQMRNGSEINWRGVYTWFTKPLADDDVLCYEGVIGGRKALFVDAKRACEKTLSLPDHIDAGKFEITDPHGGIEISAPEAHTLKITAEKAAGCVLLLRK